MAEGDKVLLLQRKQNKLSTTHDPDPYNVVSKKGDLVVIERGETQLKRNVGHVKRFIGSTPQTRQPQHAGIQPLAQPLVQQPVTEPATLPVPEPVEVLPQEVYAGTFTTTCCCSGTRTEQRTSKIYAAEK